MKPCRFAISALCLCVCAAEVSSASESKFVGVYLDFESAPTPTAFETIKREVSSIMLPSGLQFEWRDISEREKQESFAALLVIRLTGTCDTLPALYSTYSPEAQAAALANTAIVDGHVLPFSQIECNEIRRFIAPVVRGSADSEAMLGRAIGRVMAHEMYHMLLEESGHAERGVARARHRREDLVSSHFRFTDADLERLRTYGNRISVSAPH